MGTILTHGGIPHISLLEGDLIENTRGEES